MLQGGLSCDRCYGECLKSQGVEVPTPYSILSKHNAEYNKETNDLTVEFASADG